MFALSASIAFNMEIGKIVLKDRLVSFLFFFDVVVATILLLQSIVWLAVYKMYTHIIANFICARGQNVRQKESLRYIFF